MITIIYKQHCFISVYTAVHGLSTISFFAHDALPLSPTVVYTPHMLTRACVPLTTILLVFCEFSMLTHVQGYKLFHIFINSKFTHNYFVGFTTHKQVEVDYFVGIEKFARG